MWGGGGGGVLIKKIKNSRGWKLSVTVLGEPRDFFLKVYVKTMYSTVYTVRSKSMINIHFSQRNNIIFSKDRSASHKLSFSTVKTVF